MDFQQLKIFINLASLKSFSRTAEVMFISQPNVSSRIKGLEEELGVPLLDRSRARELALTEEGRILLDYAQNIINLQEEALEKLSGSVSPPEGPVLLGASTVPGIYLLPPLLARFRDSLSGVNISLVTMDTDQIIERVLNYSVDLGFVGSELQDERLEYQPFATDELIIIAPPGLLPVGETQGGTEKEQGITIEECFPYKLLIREKGSATRRLFEDALNKKGLSISSFNSVMCLDSVEGIKQGVRHGLGISLVSRHTARDNIAFGLVDAFKLKSFQLKRNIFLVRHKGRIFSRAAGLVASILQDTADIKG